MSVPCRVTSVTTQTEGFAEVKLTGARTAISLVVPLAECERWIVGQTVDLTITRAVEVEESQEEVQAPKSKAAKGYKQLDVS